MATSAEANRPNVKPVFVKDDDIRKQGEEYLKEEVFYFALNDVINCDHLIGAQKVKNLWRIYIDDHSERVKVLTSGLNINGKHINVHDKNPYLSSGDNETRVLVKDVPLSVRNEEITDALKKIGCKILSDIQFIKFRINGKLSRFLNGDRAVLVEPFKGSLPRFLKINNFNARIFHKDQKVEIKCFECGLTGHKVNECPQRLATTVCHACKKTGHIAVNCDDGKARGRPSDPVSTPAVPQDQSSDIVHSSYSEPDTTDDEGENVSDIESNPHEQTETDEVRNVISVIEDLLCKPVNPINASHSLELDERVKEIMNEAIGRVKSLSQEESVSNGCEEFEISKQEKKKIKKRKKKESKNSVKQNKTTVKANKNTKGIRFITDFATSSKPETSTMTDAATNARQNFAAAKRKRRKECRKERKEIRFYQLK